jgi:hypothetical protein
MALIVVQHDVVDNYPVDPNYSITNSGAILQGAIVGLNSSGYVELAGNTSDGVLPLGIAGDSISNEYRITAYGADLIISAAGAKRWTQPRVSDNYNETLASGMMTVYFGAGRFATDQFVPTDSWTGSFGKAVYSNGDGLFTLSSNGSAARQVGYVVLPPQDYPSGVPGADAPSVDLSMSLGQFLTVALSLR